MSSEQESAAALKRQMAENQRIVDQLNRELARKNQEVRIIQQISTEITSTLELDQIMEILLSAMEKVLGFQYVMILLKDHATEKLRVCACRGYAASAVGTEVAMGQGVIGVVAERKKMMRVGNIGVSVRYLMAVRENLQGAGQAGLNQAPVQLPGLPNAQSQLAMPLLVKDRLVGVLAVESPTPNAFDELDEILLSIVASQAATAIENARMYRMVEQLSRLKRFFSPQLAEMIVAGGAEDPLKTHRREIIVVFLDLRGFTTFAELAEPEEVMGVLRDYHAEMGKLILEHEGTLERFTGDGMMIFFNDPMPVPNPAERALRMALSMRERVQGLSARWRRRGHDLSLGIGIAQGYATIGAIGFEGRWDYGAIGTVTNLAARLCGEAKGDQILVSARVASELEELIEAEEVGPLVLKGFHKPIFAANVLAIEPNTKASD
ncbi:MAG: GAF domain-containing protein [Deltaproteobacteria bacterium]|nr:GAF domain-containing protein [Deltaproteobacteria bacterium]